MQLACSVRELHVCVALERERHVGAARGSRGEATEARRTKRIEQSADLSRHTDGCRLTLAARLLRPPRAAAAAAAAAAMQVPRVPRRDRISLALSALH